MVTLKSARLLALALLAATSPLLPAATVDGVAAVVNGKVITFSEVRSVLAPREMALRQTLTGPELEAKLKEARQGALDDLINKELILAEFQKNQFQIPEYFLDERIKDIIREDFKGDRNAFLAELRKQNFTIKKLRDIERDKIIVAAMRQKQVKRELTVSPFKVEDYYNSHRDEFTVPGKVKLRMIAIKKLSDLPGSDPESQKLVIQEIKAKLKDGADFGRMAQTYSEDGMAEYQGDWGWVEKRTLNPELGKYAFRLSKGEISDVIEFADSYYLMFAEDKIDERFKPITEVREEVRTKLEQQETRKIEERWVKGLRAKAYIKTY